MGGGSTAHVLAENPGYRAGFCFAPWPAKLSFADSAAKITVPMGIVHGKGDTVLPWRSTAKALYDGLGEGPARRFLYLLDGRCKHQNVARSVFFGKRADKQVFAATSDICVAFFEEQLRGRGGATAAAFDAAEGAGRAAELWDSRAP